MAGAELLVPGQAPGDEISASSVTPIRIHLGPMPAMLHGIVRDLLAAEPDFVIVGTSGADEDPLARARQERADMVITQDRGEGGSSALDAIISGPPVSIFAISQDGRQAAAVELVRQVISLDTGRKAGFADAVRSVAAGLPC
jgi:hypothetical protein